MIDHHNKSIGPFILETPIGKGSMGEVWKARHKKSDTLVAIKVLLSEASSDRWAHDAFQSEIRTAASLTHPNAVMVLDHGTISEDECSPASVEHFGKGNPYLVMEFVRGRTWLSLCGSLSWIEALPLIKQLLEALAHAHARRIIHRDIKPENILVEYSPNEQMNAVLTDFGLSQALSELEKDSGIISGTPTYMAPEQLQGNWRDQGPWTDLYSLGCTIWRLFCEQAPFGSNLNYVDACQHHGSSTIPPFPNIVPVPEDLERWLCQLLSKDPDHRFQCAADALEDLTNFSTRMLPPFSQFEKSKEQPTMNHNTLAFEPHPSPRTSIRTTQSLDKGSLSIPKTWKVRPPSRKPIHVHGLGLNLFHLRSFPFIGQYTVRDHLWNELIEVMRQGSRAVIVKGTEGTGKSHIAKWLCLRAEELGAATTFRIQYDDESSARDGVCKALRDVYRCQNLTQDEMKERLHVLLHKNENLSSEIPKIVSLLQPTDLSSEESIDLKEHERHGYMLKLLMYSTQSSSSNITKPIICWIDNAHQGLEGLRLCRSIISSDYAQSIPILFVITKDENLSDRHQERIEIAALQNHHRCKNVQLSRIGNEDHKRICSSFLDFSPSLLDELCRQTQGNPHYAKETIAEWIRQQILVYSPQGFILKEGSSFYVPKNIRKIWRARIASATKNFEQSMFMMAELAALLGIHVYMEEWVALDTSYPEEKRTYIVDMLQSYRIAHRWKNGKGWSFQHPLIPKLFIKNAEKFNRTNQGHLRIVDMLVEYKRVNTFERIGYHLLQADIVENGLKQTLLGIKLRIRRCEQDKALELIDFYEQNLKIAKISESDERWGVIWSLRFEISYELQNQAVLEELKTKLRRALVRYRWPRTQSYFLAIEGHELLSAGLSQEAKFLFEHGSLLAQEAGDKQCFFRHQRGLVQYYQRIGNNEEARAILKKLSKEAKSLRDRYLQGMCALYEAMIELQSNHLERAEKILQHTVQHFLKYKLLRYASEGINMLGDVHRKSGNFEKAERYYMNAIIKMEQINHPELIIPQLNLSILRIEKGDFSKLQAELTQTIPDLEANNKNTLALFARSILLVAQINLGDWIYAEENLRQITSLLHQTSMIDSDVAALLEKSGASIPINKHPILKRNLFRLAQQQYEKLKRSKKSEELKAKIVIEENRRTH